MMRVPLKLEWMNCALRDGFIHGDSLIGRSGTRTLPYRNRY